MASLGAYSLCSRFLSFSVSCLLICFMCFIDSAAQDTKFDNEVTIDSLRGSLEKQEDFIVFSLIERARYPYNSPVYEASYFKNSSFVEAFVRETEAIQAKFGRYQNPEELPFFPRYTHLQVVPPSRFAQILDPRASSVNVSRTIWEFYFSNVLQLITRKGDDGNYQQAAAADLICLQALSKRIHFGRFVAEVKFRGAPLDFTSAIQAKDTETLTELLTSRFVEEKVIERVTKKAEVFGQTVTVEKDAKGTTKDVNENDEYKVEPSIVSKLYSEWVIPLTKQVEVNYLLRRLD